jgi:hypothetical protein
MAAPDFLICTECESPVYVFEWVDGQVTEAICSSCGNDKPALFTTDEDYGEEMALRHDDGGDE